MRSYRSFSNREMLGNIDHVRYLVIRSAKRVGVDGEIHGVRSSHSHLIQPTSHQRVRKAMLVQLGPCPFAAPHPAQRIADAVADSNMVAMTVASIEDHNHVRLNVFDDKDK